ncbi:glycosyltransferase [Halalkalicoccus tibetensis]|uniref:Glycosyltransferase n=1 Tax=Halalkalicoccus tibetensis TaxID=175632 RepID=A0ABD5V4Q4_9EURY
MVSVSVIVPCYNSEGTLSECLESLVNQSYDDINQIIVVDNGSTDNSKTIANSYPVNTFDYTAIQGSYAARNFGIKQTNSELIAFTDADCTPHHDWIAQLVSCYQSSSADLVGGSVDFNFSTNSTFEIHDATTSMNNKRLVKERGSSVTANLLVRASIFEDIGLFPADLRSGGDVKWTRSAVRSGYEITYCETATIKHPTRNSIELFKKYYRLGYGEGQKIKNSGNITILKRISISLLPRPFSYIRRDLNFNNMSASRLTLLQLFFVGWICRMIQGYGKINGIKSKVESN